MARKPEVTLQEMTKTLVEGLHRVSVTPNIWNYRPHDKQIKFHKSTRRKRLYIGGNRSGKTVGGINEDIWWLMGNHPYKRTPDPPIHGRIIGVDFENGIERILKPNMKRWLPPSALKNGSWEDSYHATTRTLTLNNGSQVEFMSYVQDVAKFAGTSRHFIHFDEEPPKSIYTENKARTVDVGGSMWFTMTPVDGMTWVYDDIFIPGTEGIDESIEVIEVDMLENPYISKVEVADFLDGLDPLERQARGAGKFVQLGGLVFKNFGPIHVVDSVDPRSLHGLRWFASMDHGLNNPTSWHWHAVYPNGSVLTFMEHYEAGWTVSQHASRIHLINAELGRVPNYYVGDPAIKQRNAETGHSIQVAYQQQGIPIIRANNEVRAGIDKMNAYLHTDDEGMPTWRITNNCPNLIKQMRRYRWKTWASAKQRDDNNAHEEPHKKDDHAVDDSRYFFSFMPDLKLREDSQPDREQLKAQIERMLHIGAPPIDASGRKLDTNWQRTGEITEWSAVSEDVGIY